MVNCSTSGNVYHHPNMSCSQVDLYLACFRSMESIFHYMTFVIALTLLLLPLCILIFYLGLKKWKRLRSLNNTDFFTINFATMKLIVFFGHALCFCGIYLEQEKMINVGFGFWAISWHGENLFHFLTCTDRYLAVVHPVSYMRLKSQRWKQIRNITTGCCWIIPLLITSLKLIGTTAQILDFFVLGSSLILLIFLNVSILCSLICSRPWKQGENKNRLNQSKQRTLYTITTILGVLILRFVWKLVWLLHDAITHTDDCAFFVYGVWADFPSTLILPLLFLHKPDTINLCLRCKKINPEGELN